VSTPLVEKGICARGRLRKSKWAGLLTQHACATCRKTVASNTPFRSTGPQTGWPTATLGVSSYDRHTGQGRPMGDQIRHSLCVVRTSLPDRYVIVKQAWSAASTGRGAPPPALPPALEIAGGRCRPAPRPRRDCRRFPLDAPAWGTCVPSTPKIDGRQRPHACRCMLLSVSEREAWCRRLRRLPDGLAGYRIRAVWTANRLDREPHETARRARKREPQAAQPPPELPTLAGGPRHGPRVRSQGGIVPGGSPSSLFTVVSASSQYSLSPRAN